jgi:hypothetical protein
MSLREILNPLNCRAMIFVIFTLFISSLFSIIPLFSIQYVVLVLIGLVIASIYVRLMSAESIRVGLALFSGIGLLFLVPILAKNYSVIRDEIFGDDLNVNTFGFFAMSCGSMALCFRSTIMQIFWAGIAMACVFFVGSRSSILGLTITIGLYIILRGDRYKISTSIWILTLILLVTIAMSSPLIVDFILDTLALDDPHRGLGSGFTGRIDKWMYYIKLFCEHPLFGIGFRCSDSDRFNLVGTTDNGYISYLLETGIVGALGLTMLVFQCLFNSWKNRNDLLSVVFLASSIGYLAHSLFERFILNVGNPGSLIFMLWLVYTIRTRIGLKSYVV